MGSKTLFKTLFGPALAAEPRQKLLQREPLEVVLEGGARVRVPLDFDEATLARLLDVLERRR